MPCSADPADSPSRELVRGAVCCWAIADARPSGGGVGTKADAVDRAAARVTKADRRIIFTWTKFIVTRLGLGESVAEVRRREAGRNPN